MYNDYNQREEETLIIENILKEGQDATLTVRRDFS